MATVDLDALATALRAAGWSTEVYVSPYTNEQRLDCAGATVSPAGHCWFDKSVVVEWDALDIIRRAVSPSAPSIEASGRVVVDRARFERLLAVAEAAKEWTDAPSGQISSENVLIEFADALKSGDLEPL